MRRARPDPPIEVINLATHLLADEVISLGNPEPGDLLRRLDYPAHRPGSTELLDRAAGVVDDD